MHRIDGRRAAPTAQHPRRGDPARASRAVRLLGGAALGWLAACGGGERAERAPNLVLITVDTLRADHLSCYGYRRDTSPFLARLAQEAFVFENAISQCGTTPQSLASLMTGLYPYADGIVTQNERFVFLLQGNRTLAGMLRERGYQTHAISSSIQACPTTGIDLGFETFDGATFDLQTERKRQLRAAEMTDRASAWLAQRTDPRPFFLWLHYIDPHHPYQPPESHAALWADETPPPAGGPVARYRFDNIHALEHPLTRRELWQLVLDYDREIRFVDDQLARLFEEALGARLADTLLVFSADHGEALGEHGLIDHNDLFESVLHVPLVLRLPGEDPPAGRIDTGVMLVDVLPTVLDYLDLGTDAPLRGTSLRPLVEGGTLDQERLRLGEYPGHRAIYHRSHKLVERAFGDDEHAWLYDLAADRAERRDLTAQRPEVSAALAERAAAELYGRALGAPAQPGELPAVTPEMLEELSKLGY